MSAVHVCHHTQVKYMLTVIHVEPLGDGPGEKPLSKTSQFKESPASSVTDL